jgi:hypothetical protein
MGNVQIDNQIGTDDLKKKILLSHKGISIIISDVIGNIQKHSNGNYKVTFLVDNGNLILKFHNNFDSNSSKIQKLRELKDYFASNENYNIFKMSSKGAFLIKDFAKQMDIKVAVNINELNFSFSIDLIINLIP